MYHQQEHSFPFAWKSLVSWSEEQLTYTTPSSHHLTRLQFHRSQQQQQYIYIKVISKTRNEWDIYKGGRNTNIIPTDIGDGCKPLSLRRRLHFLHCNIKVRRGDSKIWTTIKKKRLKKVGMRREREREETKGENEGKEEGNTGHLLGGECRSRLQHICYFLMILQYLTCFFLMISSSSNGAIGAGVNRRGDYIMEDAIDSNSRCFGHEGEKISADESRTVPSNSCVVKVSGESELWRHHLNDFHSRMLVGNAQGDFSMKSTTTAQCWFDGIRARCRCNHHHTFTIFRAEFIYSVWIYKYIKKKYRKKRKTEVDRNTRERDRKREYPNKSKVVRRFAVPFPLRHFLSS